MSLPETTNTSLQAIGQDHSTWCHKMNSVQFCSILFIEPALPKTLRNKPENEFCSFCSFCSPKISLIGILAWLLLRCFASQLIIGDLHVPSCFRSAILAQAL